jgi:uncharacterized protein
MKTAPLLPPQETDDYGLMELSRRECLALLASVPVGRLVYTSRAMPAVVPLTFVLLRDSLYVRTTEETGLRVTTAGVVVAFQADAVDPSARSGWSVTVVGRAVPESEPYVLAELDALPLVPWASGRRDTVVRLPLELVTGRRVGSGPVRPGAVAARAQS